MKTIVNWQLPIKTASESNSSEHWTVKRKRHKIQQGWVNMVFLQDKPIVEIPCNIVVTRIAPRSLDSHDNLPMSLKWICDSIADNIARLSPSSFITPYSNVNISSAVFISFSFLNRH